MSDFKPTHRYFQADRMCLGFLVGTLVTYVKPYEDGVTAPGTVAYYKSADGLIQNVLVNCMEAL